MCVCVCVCLSVDLLVYNYICTYAYIIVTSAFTCTVVSSTYIDFTTLQKYGTYVSENMAVPE